MSSKDDYNQPVLARCLSQLINVMSDQGLTVTSFPLDYITRGRDIYLQSEWPPYLQTQGKWMKATPTHRSRYVICVGTKTSKHAFEYLKEPLKEPSH